jgi:hypothetical protein
MEPWRGGDLFCGRLLLVKPPHITVLFPFPWPNLSISSTTHCMQENPPKQAYWRRCVSDLRVIRGFLYDVPGSNLCIASKRVTEEKEKS